MKTAVLTPNGFEIHKTDVPTIGDDELLIRTDASGICSGDLFVYQNRDSMAARYGRLGHEGSGQIVQMGNDISGFCIGEWVTALTQPVYAEYFVAKPQELVALPAGVEPAYALGEAIACCVHAAGRFGIRPGDRVAVVGCGFMGLVCLQLARYQGAGLIGAFDPVEERLAMAKRFGAAFGYQPGMMTPQAVLETHGPFDIVIEAAGVQSAIDLCTTLVCQHGRLILVGYHQSNGGMRTVNMQQWNYKAIDVVNGHVRRADEKLAAMREGMQLLAQGHVETKPLVTVYAFEEIQAVFEQLERRQPDLLKAVLKM